MSEAARKADSVGSQQVRPHSEGGATQSLVAKCHELEVTCRLWIAANDAKEARIHELEAECDQLRRRIARLGRRVGRSQNVAALDQVRFAR